MDYTYIPSCLDAENLVATTGIEGITTSISPSVIVTISVDTALTDEQKSTLDNYMASIGWTYTGES